MRKHVHQWKVSTLNETLVNGRFVWLATFRCPRCGEPGFNASEERVEALRKKWAS